jgi:hypothetical protein
MSIRENFIDDGLELSLIQSRMTVAGMALAALFFAGSFSLALHGQNRTPQSASYQVEYAQIQLSLALGVCLVISSIASLLMCQQLPAASSLWRGSRRLWFAASTIWLYLALSQALSAGLSEVVYGLSLSSRVAGLGLAVMALPVWLALIFGWPLHLLKKLRPSLSKPEWRILLAAYLAPLMGILLLTSSVSQTSYSSVGDWLNYLVLVISQIVQPLTWPI